MGYRSDRNTTGRGGGGTFLRSEAAENPMAHANANPPRKMDSSGAAVADSGRACWFLSPPHRQLYMLYVRVQ